MNIPLVVAGAGLLVASLWCRSGSSEAARWWVGSQWNERAILFVLPGLGLILIAAGLLSGYTRDETWKLALTPIAIVGMVMAMWGALFLTIPRWWAPSWTISERGTIMESKVCGVRNIPESQRWDQP